MNLGFPPLEQYANTHKDYPQLLKDKPEFIAPILLNYKIQQVQDRVLKGSMYQRDKTFSDGNLIYFLASYAPSLQTGATKF